MMQATQPIAPAPRRGAAGHPLMPLLRRGIGAETIRHFEIKPAVVRDTDDATGERFMALRAVYPIRAGDGHVAGYRSRRLAVERGRKNSWEPGHEADAAQWVYGIETAIAGEPMLLAEGDPDMWLMHTLGIPAATLLSPMGRPSAGAIAQFKAARPSLILVAYDNDAAGHAGGPRVVRALRDAGLTADALALPADMLPDKGDLTDLYHAVGRDRRAFVDALKRCGRLSIPAPEPPREMRPLRRVAGGNGTAPWETFNAANDIVAVAERIGQVKRAGAAYVVRCPFHDDHTPSLYVYPRDQHFYCFVCGAWGSAYDLGRKIGAA